MELRQLKCFLACARNHSLTLAAEELYTTQPHVSMVIKSLEQELGTPLFIRKSKGVELTEAGKRIYSYAVNAVRNAEAISALSSQNEIPFLRIVSNSSSHMALLLTHYYLQQKEKLKIEYRECGIEEMMERVSEGMDDLGFLFVPDNRRSVLRHMLERRFLEFVPLLTTDLVLYVRKEHPLYGRKSVRPEELSDLEFIQLDDDFFSVEAMVEEVLPSGKRYHDLPKVVTTNSSSLMIRMLENTDLCNVGSYWLSEMYRQNDFGRIRIEGLEQKIRFGYLKYQGRPLIPGLVDFLSFLEGALEKDHEMI